MATRMKSVEEREQPRELLEIHGILSSLSLGLAWQELDRFRRTRITGHKI